MKKENEQKCCYYISSHWVYSGQSARGYLEDTRGGSGPVNLFGREIMSGPENFYEVILSIILKEFRCDCDAQHWQIFTQLQCN